MNERDEINDFLMGSGATAFPFDNLGDSVTGIIIDMKKVQQTDMDTKQPAFWDNGDPKMMLRVTLQTELHDNDDDEGYRSVYLRGGNPTAVKGKGTSSLQAVKDAVRRAQSPNGIQAGGLLTLTYSGEGERKNRAFNPPKLYTAEYQAASLLDIDEMA